jgi:hypothetical protein
MTGLNFNTPFAKVYPVLPPQPTSTAQAPQPPALIALTGDDWQHTIKIDRLADAEPDVMHPQWIAQSSSVLQRDRAAETLVRPGERKPAVSSPIVAEAQLSADTLDVLAKAYIDLAEA